MMQLVAEFTWSEVFSIEKTNKNTLLKKVIRIFSYYSLALSLKKKYKQYDLCLFIGEFRSSWMQLSATLTNPNNKYLLDDGDITISVQKKYLTNNKNHPFVFDGTIKSFAKSILYLPVLLQKKSKEKLRLFTAFNLTPIGNQVIEKNNYSFTINKYSSNKIKTNLVYYFGSKYSEAKLIGQEIEIDFLRKVFSCYVLENVRYIPHRDDSVEKLNAIRKLGATILEIDLPAEIYLLRSEIEPLVICGACTTVLSNAKKITPEIKIQSFLLPLHHIKDVNLREDIERSYENLAELKVDVIDTYKTNFIMAKLPLLTRSS